MSKLYNKYIELKRSDKRKCYLFKAGLFYIFIDEDAKQVAGKLNLMLTKLNDQVSKCGFPLNALEKYIEKMKANKIKFVIIDDNKPISNHTKYLTNNKILNFINKIKKLDLDDISYKEAYQILLNFKAIIMKLNADN